MEYTKLKYTYETMELDSMMIAVPVGKGADEFHGVIKMNETALFILDLLKEDISEENIIKETAKEYGMLPNDVSSDVRECLKEFQEHGMLV